MILFVIEKNLNLNLIIIFPSTGSWCPDKIKIWGFLKISLTNLNYTLVWNSVLFLQIVALREFLQSTSKFLTQLNKWGKIFSIIYH